MKIQFDEMDALSFPPGMEGWKLFYIKYVNEEGESVTDGRIWLPANFDPNHILYMIFGQDLGE